MSETHPHLIEIYFRSFTPLTDELPIEFQALNPQLQILSTSGCDLTTSILQGIATRVPNLVELEFSVKYQGDKIVLKTFQEDIRHLSGLRHLKRLIYPYCTHPISSSLFVDILADNDIPIEGRVFIMDISILLIDFHICIGIDLLFNILLS